jgi:hypothetical protein
MDLAASKGSVAIFLLRIVLTKWHVALHRFCIVITTMLLFVSCKPTAFLCDHRRWLLLAQFHTSRISKGGM